MSLVIKRSIYFAARIEVGEQRRYLFFRCMALNQFKY